MLVLVAFDLTRAMGMPADIVWVADDDGLPELQARAFKEWGTTGHMPAECEVVEVWRIQPGPTWDEQLTKVCRLVRGEWVFYD